MKILYGYEIVFGEFIRHITSPQPQGGIRKVSKADPDLQGEQPKTNIRQLKPILQLPERQGAYCKKCFSEGLTIKR